MFVAPREIRYYKTIGRKVPYWIWFSSLGDEKIKNIIRTRLDRVSLGNFGDSMSIGHGIFELRINGGPGYRIYFGMDGIKLVILLCGGDKGSQARDIKMAQDFWTDYRRRTR